ncbi:MAG: hypothetical protein DHS20C18_50710 [Saprospiraceae bacterium]|nr:MAG: hypothetical protein DHS20C18_50710 [Saprospiraceae bacterium]
MAVALLSLLAYQPINAQCNLACNGTPDAPLHIAVGLNCQIVLDPDAVLEAPQSCPGDKQMSVRDGQNNLITDGLNLVSFDGAPYIGQVLSVTTEDVTTGIICVSFVDISDNFVPVFTTCPDATISCVGDTSVAVIGTPLVSDNCGAADVDLSYTDNFQLENCLSANVATVVRSWTARDVFGNTATCNQNIFLQRPDLQQIVFPDNVNLDCDSPDTNPSNTGEPEFGGESIMVGGLCGLSIIMDDETTTLCGDAEYQILRTWTVTDNCTGFSNSAVQIIFVQDETSPSITCPDPITFSTISGQCYATVTLPAPSLSDNCDAAPTYSVSTNYGAVGLGPHPFVPSGEHTIQYTASDECGNISICSTTLTVYDGEAPIAVCDDELVVSIPSGGIAMVNAISFDEGSTDNCADTVYLKVLRQTLGTCDGVAGDDSDIIGYQEWFDDKVYFCCSEMNDGEILVTLRVYEINPGPGPVNPNREQLTGDLYGHFSDCVVSVRLQDQINPQFQYCPPNRIIGCKDDYEDLSVFGSPVARDNCSYSLDSTAVFDIDNCGLGSIVRTWTAIDPSEHSSTCTQTIYLENNLPMEEDLINWPPTYTVNNCGGSTDPEDLPVGYREPTYDGETCGILAYNYDDQLFNIAFPACYKIIRTWTVIDWCVYNPDDLNSEGKFSHNQIIKVQDDDAPTISCPENITANVANNCSTRAVTIEPAVAEDCNPSVLITNDSPYAYNNGANASGIYPLGTTVVTFTASDRCGNITTCSMEVTVEDLSAPAPLCIVGLSINLGMGPNGISGSINAEAFNGGTSDNCTDASELVYSIRKNGTGDEVLAPTTTVLTFSCEDVGTQLIQLWATDNNGNSDFCTTYISIQDNNTLCPVITTMGMIAGEIVTPFGENVEDVMVTINDITNNQVMTQSTGLFQFPDVPLGNDYTIMPERNEEPLNGVSTIDMILISKHILGVAHLDSPYKIIAADVDRSGGVSTLDLIKLRKLILHVVDEFPNGNTSWRFVAAEYEFPDPTNPFAGYFPELVSINDFDADEMYADFIAVKVGDVNNSVTPNNLSDPDDRATYGEMGMAVRNQTLEAGETYTIDFIARDMDKILGYQFTFGFDPEALEFVEVNSGMLPGLDEENFGYLAAESGMITTSWNQHGELPDNKEGVLFSITFYSNANAELQDLIYINSRLTKAEAYTLEGDVLEVGLNFLEGNTASEPTGYALYQNRPNPFSDDTIIPFQLAEAGVVRMRVYDLAGRTIYQMERQFESGYNELLIGKSDLSITGIMYYQIEAGNWKDTKKMMLTE